MDSQPIIRVSDLTKVYRSFDRREGIGGALFDLFKRRYRDVRAVDGVNFSIDRGEMVGYIGANGAGKSTTVKMLTGILTPTSGTITVNGLVPGKQRYAHARQIGVVFGQRTQLWWDLAVIEAYNLLQKIYQVPFDLYRARLAGFVEVLGIEEQLHVPVRKLSLGQRMKCDLCASLLHRPPLLFLDEPTIGLDVAVKERIRRFIRYINREEGTTIILTTHDLTDIEELCPRIMIIDRGRIIYDGATAQIKERFGRRRRLVVSFKRDYLPEHAGKPLPPAEAPIAFAGLDPVRLERLGNDGEEHERPAVDIDVPAVLAEHGPETAVQVGDLLISAASTSASGINSLDEPGARQFMAELAGLMDNGGHLRVRRLNLRQYQVSFDRKRYTGGEVIGRLMERFEVDDLQLHEPELSDIVRAIYEGRHQI